MTVYHMLHDGSLWLLAACLVMVAGVKLLLDGHGTDR